VTALPAYTVNSAAFSGRSCDVPLASTRTELESERARVRPRRSSAGDLLRRLAGAVWADDQPYGDPISFVDPLAAWRGQALCTTSTPARATCRACPPRWRCLEFALRNREPFGRWGGLSTLARQQLLAAHDGDVTEALIAAWVSEHPTDEVDAA
jgi:hypothetical protein